MASLPQAGIPQLPEVTGSDKFDLGLVGFNTPYQVAMRRGMVFDHNGSTRVAAQIEHDLGSYVRPAVGPVEYGEGNIKKSTAVSGPAGYNQRAVPLPDSPDDMSQEQYMLSLMQNKPEQRMRMRMAMSIPKQNFLYRPPVSSEYPLSTHNMMTNLLALAKQKQG